MIGSECCAVIPLHTGPLGPLSTLLDRMAATRDQIVNNNAVPESDWYNWLFSNNWIAGLVRIGVTILVALIVMEILYYQLDENSPQPSAAQGKNLITP
ncbi:hypothetical protein QTP70_003115 [Hemibagrus guttatus]|uniref:Uncharacterized protein n=1 Tax=Hemibagrus guttatus TaxID=175788 RepID=A0AAE0PPX0_9TELE|nr:hypothetical protein QTP70_003115 [Hemibagrus guttatus]